MMQRVDVPKPLSQREAVRLEALERVIAENLHGVFLVGRALLEIRDQKLYRINYGTFEDYCREVWDLGRPRAYQLIGGTAVFDHLSTIVDKTQDNYLELLPANEAQTRPLAPLTPDTQLEVWTLVIETSKGSSGRITANLVQQCVNIIRQGKISKSLNRVKNSTTIKNGWISEETKGAFQALMDAIQHEAKGELQRDTLKELANSLRTVLEEIESC